MSYSQPDPAEETTQGQPEQPDTDKQEVETSDDVDTALEIDADQVPTSSDDDAS